MCARILKQCDPRASASPIDDSVSAPEVQRSPDSRRMDVPPHHPNAQGGAGPHGDDNLESDRVGPEIPALVGRRQAFPRPAATVGIAIPNMGDAFRRHDGERHRAGLRAFPSNADRWLAPRLDDADIGLHQIDVDSIGRALPPPVGGGGRGHGGRDGHRGGDSEYIHAAAGATPTQGLAICALRSKGEIPVMHSRGKRPTATIIASGCGSDANGVLMQCDQRSDHIGSRRRPAGSPSRTPIQPKRGQSPR